MISVFTDKLHQPETIELETALGSSYAVWEELSAYVSKVYPAARKEWSYGGEKYGWSFRINDKKRAIIYLLPRAGFFRAAFVFGMRATEAVMAENISESIKAELAGARVYAEGRGIRVEVRDGSCIPDLKKLIDIKCRF